MDIKKSNCTDVLYSDKERGLCPRKSLYAEYIRTQKHTLGKRLKEIQREFDIRNKEIVYKTGLSDAMVDRLRNDRNDGHDVITIVKLCAGLDLYPPIAHELFVLAGVALNTSVFQNFVYQYIIDNMYLKTAEEKEQLLEESGFSRLGIQD